MNKPYDPETIETFLRSILEDEFDDSTQNTEAYAGTVSGYDVLKRLVTVDRIEQPGHGICGTLDVGAGGSRLGDTLPVPLPFYTLEPCPNRAKEDGLVIEGWCENICTEPARRFDLIMCWGVIHFARSVPETLIQFNKRLVPNGVLILDTATYSVMPLMQTVHPDCFVRYAQLFGFELVCRIPFEVRSTQRREGFRFRKARDFDYRYLRIPQCSSRVAGQINNYLDERDWYLRG